MHAKQRNPSRIQAQEVAQKGPECDAKVCLTRPPNPLKTLGPGLNSCLTFKPVPKHLVFSFVFGSLKTCFRFFGNTCFFDFWARF